MTIRWTFGHYPPDKLPWLAFSAPPEGRRLNKAVIRSLIRDVLKEGS